MADHVEIGDLNVDATKRDVFRSIQTRFDDAEDDVAREALLRGLPVPELH